MKVCIFSGYFPDFTGGAEFQAKLIASELDKDNEVFYISLGTAFDSVDYKDGLKVYSISFNSNVNKYLWYFPVKQKIIKILNIEKPDVIYQRVLNSFSFHLSQFSSNNHIPLFIHISDNYCLEFGSNLSSRIRKFMFHRILRNNFNHFITQTSLQTKLLANFNVEPILQIPNLHLLPDTDDFNFVNPDKKVILWIGSARKVKQLEKFISLAKSFITNQKVCFKVIGRINNNTSYGMMLNKAIDALDNIEHVGEQSSEYVNQALSSSFLLVNTSISEGFSNTFIQAWMRGIPVVSLNSDPDDFISNHNLGGICYGNENNLKIYIEDFLSNPTKYKEISESCLRISYEMFSFSGNIFKLKEVLLNH